LEG
jgi:hypothetical protein